MLARLIVYILLIISATQFFMNNFQALPSTDTVVGQEAVLTTLDVVVTGEKLHCIEKIQWYRNVTKELEEMLDKFSEMLTTKEMNEHDRIRIKAENDQIENIKSDSMKKFDPDLEKLSHILDANIRHNWCEQEMKMYLELRRNSILAGVKLKSNVLNILDHAEVSKPVKNDFDKSLSEKVNWLFKTDVNMLRNVDKLRESYTNITENGRKLEEEWTLRSDSKVEVPPVAEPQYHDEDIANKEWDKLMQEEKKKILEHKVFDETEASFPEQMKNQSDDQGHDSSDDGDDGL